MTTKAKAKKPAVVLNDVQSAIVRKYSALSTKASDAYNGLTSYSQEFMTSSVLFDGSWSEEAIEDLNKALKAMQSKIERKSAGYSTFSSAKSVILKAFRLGVADVRKSKSDLETECKAIAQANAEANASESGESEAPQDNGKDSPQALIEKALKMLIESGDQSPMKTAQSLLIMASTNLNKKK
jgi:vacuolar-type H+-ATPase subunit D/Vma8